MMIADAVSIVLAIFLLIATGMAMTRAGWIDAGGAKLLARLTVNVGLSALVAHNLMTQFTRETLTSSMPGILVSYGSMILTLLAGAVLARLIGIEQKKRGVFICMIGFSNAVFIGLPVAEALFGPSVTPHALIYYIANTSLFWSVGYYLLSRDGGQSGKVEIKKLLPAPMIAFLLSVALVMLDVELPAFLLSTGKYLGALVTPVSLIYTGYVIMGMISMGHVRWRRGYAWVVLGRFLLGPALLIAMTWLVPVSGGLRNALLIQSAMPVMAQTTIVAGEMGADAEYVAGGIALTTAMTIAVVPVFMALIPYL